MTLANGSHVLICNGLRAKVRISANSAVAYWLREAGLCSKGRYLSSRLPGAPFCYLEQDPSYPLLGTGLNQEDRKT